MESLVNNAPVYYYSNFLNKEEATTLYKELSDTDVQRHTYQGRNLARHTAVYGDDVSKVPPEIWGDNVKITKWSPVMKKVLEKVNKELNVQFNVCLVNVYESGKDFIGWHSDKEERGDTYQIASISLGAVRKFSFMHMSKELGGDEERISVNLDDGSLLVMKHPCQDKYLHCLPKMGAGINKRINLTFRKFHYDD